MVEHSAIHRIKEALCNVIAGIIIKQSTVFLFDSHEERTRGMLFCQHGFQLLANKADMMVVKTDACF